MPQISVWPEEAIVPFDDEVNILEALLSANLPIEHLCGGRARCSTCRVAIVEGLGDLSVRTEAEAAMATRLDFPDQVRLACQTTASRSLRLRRLVLDKQDVELASQLGKPKFVGPRFMIRVASLEMNPLDDDDRIPELREQFGSGLCNITRCCTEVCPEHINITDNGIIPMKERVVDRYYDPVLWVGRKLLGIKRRTKARPEDQKGDTT